MRCACSRMCGCQWRPEEGFRYLGDGVASMCQLPDMKGGPEPQPSRQSSEHFEHSVIFRASPGSLQLLSRRTNYFYSFVLLYVNRIACSESNFTLECVKRRQKTKGLLGS